MAAVALAVAAMGGVMVWNLRTGFADYLAARDIERLESFVGIAAKALAEAGGADALRDRRLSMRELMDELARTEGMARPPKPPPPRRDGFERGPGPPKPPRGGGEGRFGERVAIYDLEGIPVIGRPLPREARYIERPVRIDGVVIAQARLAETTTVPEGVDARFLRRQYLGIIAVAVLLTLLALASAWLVARRWAKPLLAIQRASERIARGELTVRLPESGTDEIADVVRNLNRMAGSLERLEGARRQWIAEFSHELRTPLTVLRGELEALMDGVRPLDASAVASLREEVLRLSKLADDLHLLAMSDLAALPCNFIPVEVGELLKRAIERFRKKAESAGLSLEFPPDPGPGLQASWDAGRIEQLLGNLIENSIRYTDAPGRIVICMHANRVQITPSVTIQVDDTPPCVAPADVERLFDPLFRADRARSRDAGGSGLGLAICKAIVAAHHGRIVAAASPLGGVRITIELPLRPQ